jgi:PAS domain S-box-containing protein
MTTELHQRAGPDLVLYKQHFFTNSLDIFCALDRSGHILRCNAALPALMGYEPEEVVDHHFTASLDSQKQRDEALAQFELLQTGQDSVKHLVR